MIATKKQKTIDGKHSLKYYKDSRQMGLITLFLIVWYILDPPGETSWCILLIAIGVVGNTTFTLHRKIKSWEKEHNADLLQYNKLKSSS